MLVCQLFAILLFCAPVYGNSKWFGSYNPTALSAGTRYIPPFAGTVNNGTETSSHQIMPAAGTVKKMYVKVSVDPAGGGGTQSVTFTFRVNAASSALTCTISEGSTTCNDTTHTAAVVAGDQVAVQKTDANTPTLGTVSFILEFEPTTANQTVLMGGSGGTSVTTGTRYHAFIDSAGDTATENTRYIVLPSGGSLKNLYIRFTANVGADTTFTLRVNGANCASSIAVTVTNGTQTGNETATTCTVSAGDTVGLQSVSAGTPGTSVAFGIMFSPTTANTFAIPYNSGSSNIASTAAATYASMSSLISLTNATETNVQTLGFSDYRLTAVYIRINTAAGASKQWDFALRENAGAPSVTFAATISGAVATSANVTGANFTPTDNALYDTIVTPTNTPSNTLLQISYLGSMATPATGRRCLLLGVC